MTPRRGVSPHGDTPRLAFRMDTVTVLILAVAPESVATDHGTFYMDGALEQFIDPGDVLTVTHTLDRMIRSYRKMR